MAGHERIEVHVPWVTILKLLAALALVWLVRELAWLIMLLFIALIIAVGLAPVVDWLERRRWPRWLAAASVVTVVLGFMIGFVGLTWASLAAQSANLGQRLRQVVDAVETHTPPVILRLLEGGKTPQSALVGLAEAAGRSLLWFVTAFALAWILVVYLLIESDLTYRWVRGFVPVSSRRRFDVTASMAREAAFGYIIGNVVTSVCAGAYVLLWLSILHVPAALLLAILAFLFDFVPVLGFFLSCGPAIAMASTVSPAVGLLMVPIYFAYHFVENYLIAPRVYGSRLRLSNVAVLMSFAIGAALGGVAGALLALPIAAVYPVVERLWLREPFGDDVVAAHERLEGGHG